MTITSTATKTVDVTITSDLMCPWCWVGLKKLQQASKQANVEPKITWKPFLLRSNIPEEGVPKGGTPASRAGARLKEAGASVGIDFTGLTDRTPNTTLFHATMKLLQEDPELDLSTATEFHEAVFEGYFTLGVFPDKDGLLHAATKLKEKDDGRVYHKISNLFRDEARLEQLRHDVHKEAKEASYNGVSGVPSFEFNGHQAFSGAQPVEHFVTYLNHFAE